MIQLSLLVNLLSLLRIINNCDNACKKKHCLAKEKVATKSCFCKSDDWENVSTKKKSREKFVQIGTVS